MGYSIEVSFNVIKNSNLSKVVQDYAEECCCDSFYEDYEFENKTQFQRRHCVLTAKFSLGKIFLLLEYLKYIKQIEGLHLESIYDEDINILLYASHYYLTQQMDKISSKKFHLEKRKRSYSEDETMILHTIKK
jgi:hypothetical protein